MNHEGNAEKRKLDDYLAFQNWKQWQKGQDCSASEKRPAKRPKQFTVPYKELLSEASTSKASTSAVPLPLLPPLPTVDFAIPNDDFAGFFTATSCEDGDEDDEPISAYASMCEAEDFGFLADLHPTVTESTPAESIILGTPAESNIPATTTTPIPNLLVESPVS